MVYGEAYGFFALFNVVILFQLTVVRLYQTGSDGGIFSSFDQKELNFITVICLHVTTFSK